MYGCLIVFVCRLLKLQQAGLIDKALEDHTSFKKPLVTETTYSNARLEHVGSAIILLGLGTLVSIVFLLIELIAAFYRYYRSNMHNEKV